MWDIIKSIVNNTEAFQTWMRKHLIHKVHSKRILLIYELAFNEKKRFDYSFSISLLKGKKKEAIQINIIIKEQGKLVHTAFVYLYSDLPLNKPGDLDKHLDRFIYTYPLYAAEFDMLLKELKENKDEDDDKYVDPSSLN